MKHEHKPEYREEHHHGHSHGGHAHVHKKTARGRLMASMILTGTTMIVEVAGGIWTGSLALISDAGHMFTHFFALALSYFAIIVASRPTTNEKSFGYFRMEILAAFTNGLVLMGVTVFIVYESVVRFITPKPIADVQMLIIAIVGLVVNLISAVLLAGVGKDDLNVKSAFLHMIGDTLSSVAIVGGAIAIYFTNWFRIDPILSALIALLIGIWSYRLLRDSVNVLLEATPKHIDVAELEKTILEKFPDIKSIHDIHVWEITSGMYSMTAHVTVDPDISVENLEKTRGGAEKFLIESYRIGHTTFQFESRTCCGGEHDHDGHDHGECCTTEPNEHKH
ncbi:MAG: cation diffusion facilitator family transporter [Planctomycetota bacterium]|jgi:cobalt-zinc-cadmium efflux system protein